MSEENKEEGKSSTPAWGYWLLLVMGSLWAFDTFYWEERQSEKSLERTQRIFESIEENRGPVYDSPATFAEEPNEDSGPDGNGLRSITPQEYLERMGGSPFRRPRQYREPGPYSEPRLQVNPQ